MGSNICKNNSSFQKDFNRASTYLKSQNKKSLIKTYRNSIKSLIPYYCNIYSKIAPANIKDFETAILDDYQRQAELIFINDTVNEYYMDLLSSRYFQTHKDEFDSYLEKIKNDPTFEIDFSDNSFNGYLTRYVYSLNNFFPTVTEDILKQRSEDSAFFEKLYKTDITLEEKLKSIQIYAKKTFVRPIAQKDFIKDCRILLLGPKEYLKEDEICFRDNISNGIKESIISIIEQLKNTGKYEEYYIKQSEQFKKIGLKNYMDSSVDLTNTSTSLNTLSIEDLLVLNSFWLNRYTKVLSNQAETLFLLKDLNLLDKIANNDSTCIDELNDETLYNELLKFHFLKNPAIRFFKQVERKIENFQTDDIEGYNENTEKNYSTYSFRPLCKKMKKEYGSEYEKYFSTVLPNCQNNISTEIDFFSKLYSPISSAYSIKSSILHALSTQLDNFPNAGIVLENQNDYKPLLGFDSELTFPVFEHLGSKELLDFYTKYTHSSKVPIYDGYTDFIDLSEHFYKTQLTLPVSKKQEDILKQMCKKRTYPEFSKNTIQHLYFLKEPSRLPDSFANETGTKKKPSRSNKRYFDLIDGKIYIKDSTGEFVLSESQNQKSPVKLSKGVEYGD